MNAQHFRAFLWLRWRLLVNQLRRGGTTNAIILAILAVGAVLSSIGMFVTFFLVGLFLLADSPPSVLLYVWDGLIVAFLFLWVTGLLVELQRSEVLSLEKFLHLPVSLGGVFLINYLSSLFCLSVIVFVPGMVALSLGLVFSKGPPLLLLLPLLAGFLLMVTALTYQFQGWLASLMVNKRRRRTIIVLVTAAVVLLAQLPNLVNILQPWKGHPVEQWDSQIESTARLVNLVLPPGWLPFGAMAAAEGHFLPALLCVLGMTSIGLVSLWRAYRTTVRLYTGHFTAGRRKPVAVAAPSAPGIPAGILLEWRLVWVSEQASAIALAGFRSLLRAPEAKMMLLSPIILVLVFGSMFLTKSVNLPEKVRPLLAAGAMTTILLSMGQLVGNQFGFDRSGFRVFVLSAAPRRDILLGKNLAFAPLALGLGALVSTVLQVLAPLRWDHFLAIFPQMISMYLPFCLLANWLSIFAPMPISSGSLKPANPRFVPLMLHLLFSFLFPLALAPALLPLGVEFLLEELDWINGAPICLLLSLLECALIVCVYLLLLTWQGSTLQAREQKVLEIVTAKTE